jgi:hypothetical protein
MCAYTSPVSLQISKLHRSSMSPKLNPKVAQVEHNIRALTTVPYKLFSLVAPPVASAQKDYIALSKAYNHLAILLTQGLEEEDGSGRQVVAVTGKVLDSCLSVCAIAEIVTRISSKGYARNPRNKLEEKQDGPTLIDVLEIQKSGTPLQDLADPIKK